MNGEISASKLKDRILSSQEIAIVDVREEGVYFNCHLLWASNIPLSRLELLIDDLVPRRTTHIALYDSGPQSKESTARRAQERLQSFGYTNVDVLTGGVEGWKSAGFELFSGLNVPSKTFGEFLVEERKPPEILAQNLHERISRDDDLVVLDSRPIDEYREMSIPTAIDVPGAELVYRVFEVAPDANTDVVVNCAGRTRSIVGAMSLINAGIPNRVMLLKDGTMGWHLAGLKLDHGRSNSATEPSEDNFEKSCAAANRVSQKFNVRFIDSDTFAAWKADNLHTLYVFDVRTTEEFINSHLRGSRHAPGGQLVQTTDEFVAVRNARIVLVDDREVRAAMTASWLMQMGHRNVAVLKHPFQNADLESGPRESVVVGFEEYETIAPGELKSALQSGEPVVVIDFSLSRNYRAMHIPQAMWCIRQRLESALALHPPIGLLVLTSEDGVLAHLAAADLIRTGSRQLTRVLEGGNVAWRDRGYPVIDGMENLLSEIDDVWDRPYDNELGQEQRMMNYLEWEVQLMDQARRDGTTEFYT